MAGALALVVFVAACGAGPTPPSVVVENYVSTIAEGNYDGACAMLPGAARSSFAGLIGPRATCISAFERCVPKQATKVSQDQTQLLYANVQTTITGSRAVTDLSGTTVASAVRQVELSERHSVWGLATYGTGLKACAIAAHRPHRH